MQRPPLIPRAVWTSPRPYRLASLEYSRPAAKSRRRRARRERRWPGRSLPFRKADGLRAARPRRRQSRPPRRRRRLEQNAVGQTENRRCSADSHRQRCDRRGGKKRALGQAPRGEPQVSKYVAHSSPEFCSRRREDSGRRILAPTVYRRCALGTTLGKCPCQSKPRTTRGSLKVRPSLRRLSGHRNVAPRSLIEVLPGVRSPVLCYHPMPRWAALPDRSVASLLDRSTA